MIKRLMMNSRERFLAACRHEVVDRPPVWLMRQAGRYLPEYQEIKAQHDFMTMCQTPELAAEISLQPWRRFGVDAVIVFSDILIPCAAMGQEVFFDDLGPHLSPTIQSQSDLAKLSDFDPGKTQHLWDTLTVLKKEIAGQAALLGFCGSPWTTVSYMVEGRSRSDPSELKIHHLMKNDPDVLHSLLQKVTQTLIHYLKGQISVGVDMIQIFESWGGSLTKKDFEVFAQPYIRELIENVTGSVPITLYCQKCEPLLESLVKTGCDILSVDWRLPLAEVRSKIPNNMVLQGNLDPQVLFHSPASIQKATEAMLANNANHPGYIANLGHGVIKGTPVESVAAFVETIKGSAPTP
jgi:uroporphyrinogen decarboxylase